MCSRSWLDSKPVCVHGTARHEVHLWTQPIDDIVCLWLSVARQVESKGGPAASPFYLLIDSNGDGLIDYSEYAFFVTVLSGTTVCVCTLWLLLTRLYAVPWEQFDIAFRLFDTNGDGGIDRHEFGQVRGIGMPSSIMNRLTGMCCSSWSSCGLSRTKGATCVTERG